MVGKARKERVNEGEGRVRENVRLWGDLGARENFIGKGRMET